ncbi:MAG: CcdB-like protein [Novosphingobium sp.]|jgi:toxin CcdB|nr:CcdB-like protein [Novosphingobium sp.]MBX9644163.1 CcdB family protein [Novosphingobium sp.]
MAQFDVHRLGSGMLVLDCQSDAVSDIVSTRFVVPLFDPDAVPQVIKNLHPLLRLHDGSVLMATPLATAIPAKDLPPPIASLESQRYAILNALDFLISGV